METRQYGKAIGRHPALFVFLTAPWQSDRVACKATYVAGAPRYLLDSLGIPRIHKENAVITLDRPVFFQLVRRIAYL